jgi:hypothetical protein
VNNGKLPDNLDLTSHNDPLRARDRPRSRKTPRLASPVFNHTQSVGGPAASAHDLRLRVANKSFRHRNVVIDLAQPDVY